MRDILFRGKRKDNGEWVCSGNLIQFFDNNIREVYISQYGERCNAVHDIDTDNIETITCENGARFYKVIPETVGQYTGLTDKNGKKIFEGDIVLVPYIDPIFKCTWNETSPCERAIVKHCNCMFYVEYIESGDKFILSAMDGYMKIIGNIYDNKADLQRRA